MELIAKTRFDLRNSHTGMEFRIYKPVFDSDFDAWSCRIEIDEPINVQLSLRGSDSMHALILALRHASTYIYGSDLYRQKLIGIDGQYGGNLFLPAPETLLDIAPYPC